MSVTVILEAHTQDGRGDDLVSLLREFLVETRQWKGCEGITVNQDEDDANTIVLLEQWDTRPDYEAYLGWRKERGDLDKLGSHLTGPPDIRFFGSVGA